MGSYNIKATCLSCVTSVGPIVSRYKVFGRSYSFPPLDSRGLREFLCVESIHEHCLSSTWVVAAFVVRTLLRKAVWGSPSFLCFRLNYSSERLRHSLVPP